MIRAYRVVEESDDSITYQYDPICGYWLYSAALLLIVGYVSSIQVLDWIGLGLIAAYFVIVYFPALADARRIKAAMATGTVTLTGTRWSFSNPLTIVVPRDASS